MLPKFLLADNSQDVPGKLFVVHTQEPRFVLEGSDEDFEQEQVMYWLDDEPKDNTQVLDLTEAAINFLDAELSNQEDLFDDMEE